MATKAELSEELASALRKYGADYGFVITDESIAKLIETEAFLTVSLEGCDDKLLAEALMKSGMILEQSDGENSYIAVVDAGVANMNHAVLALQLDGESLSIAAVAKEGLIKQGTAKKAIEKVMRYLREKR